MFGMYQYRIHTTVHGPTRLIPTPGEPGKQVRVVGTHALALPYTKRSERETRTRVLHDVRRASFIFETYRHRVLSAVRGRTRFIKGKPYHSIPKHTEI